MTLTDADLVHRILKEAEEQELLPLDVIEVAVKWFLSDDRTDGKDTGLRNAEGKAVMFKVWVDS